MRFTSRNEFLDIAIAMIEHETLQGVQSRKLNGLHAYWENIDEYDIYRDIASLWIKSRETEHLWIHPGLLKEFETACSTERDNTDEEYRRRRAEATLSLKHLLNQNKHFIAQVQDYQNTIREHADSMLCPFQAIEMIYKSAAAMGVAEADAGMFSAVALSCNITDRYGQQQPSLLGAIYAAASLLSPEVAQKSPSKKLHKSCQHMYFCLADLNDRPAAPFSEQEAADLVLHISQATDSQTRLIHSLATDPDPVKRILWQIHQIGKPDHLSAADIIKSIQSIIANEMASGILVTSTSIETVLNFSNKMLCTLGIEHQITLQACLMVLRFNARRNIKRAA